MIFRKIIAVDSENYLTLNYALPKNTELFSVKFVAAGNKN